MKCLKVFSSVMMMSIFILMLVSGCSPSPAPEISSQEQTKQQELSVMTHDSFMVSEALITTFEEENNIKITFLKSGDTGAALNRAILSKESPQADVFYGIDNTFLSRALEEDIFEPYSSPMLDGISEDFILDKQTRVLPVDFGDVCINYDKAYFTENSLAVPHSLEDLIKPEYKGLLAVENPATSSPGLSFLLATIGHFGSDGYLNYWEQLRDNQLVVVNDWETAYYTNFSASTGKGSQPMIVSYASSPPVEVIYASEPLDEAPTAAITDPDTCYRQIEFVGILKGTKNRAAAEKFIDFMLSVPFQEDMPLQMFVYPVNPKASLPDEFTRYVQVPSQPVIVNPDEIAKNRANWINEWTNTVLR